MIVLMEITLENQTNNGKKNPKCNCNDIEEEEFQKFAIEEVLEKLLPKYLVTYRYVIITLPSSKYYFIKLLWRTSRPTILSLV